MERNDLAADPRYSSHQSRGRHQRELDELISGWTITQSMHAVLELMDRHGVPAGLIYRAPDMIQDPHFAAREAIVTVHHPHYGDLKMQNVAPKLSKSPGSVRSVAPALGQHNEEVYSILLNYSPARLAELKHRRVI
jgi:crotonobetainyl-CoA:carnitine CoA-transferase CaiB-like acyl-CoA transferase